MLEENNFNGVPGYSTRDGDILRRAFQEFVADVDAEYSQGASVRHLEGGVLRRLFPLWLGFILVS